MPSSLTPLSAERFSSISVADLQSHKKPRQTSTRIRSRSFSASSDSQFRRAVHGVDHLSPGGFGFQFPQPPAQSPSMQTKISERIRQASGTSSARVQHAQHHHWSQSDRSLSDFDATVSFEDSSMPLITPVAQRTHDVYSMDKAQPTVTNRVKPEAGLPRPRLRSNSDSVLPTPNMKSSKSGRLAVRSRNGSISSVASSRADTVDFIDSLKSAKRARVGGETEGLPTYDENASWVPMPGRRERASISSDVSGPSDFTADLKSLMNGAPQVRKADAKGTGRGETSESSKQNTEPVSATREKQVESEPKTQQEGLAAQSAAHEEALAALHLELSKSQTENLRLNDSLTSTEAEKKDLFRSLSAEKSRTTQLIMNLDAAESENSTLQRQVQELERQIAFLEEQNEALLSRVTFAEKKARDAETKEKQVTELSARCREADMQTSLEADKLLDLLKKVEESEAEKDAAELRLEAAEKRAEAAEESERAKDETVEKMAGLAAKRVEAAKKKVLASEGRASAAEERVTAAEKRATAAEERANAAKQSADENAETAQRREATEKAKAAERAAEARAIALIQRVEMAEERVTELEDEVKWYEDEREKYLAHLETVLDFSNKLGKQVMWEWGRREVGKTKVTTAEGGTKSGMGYRYRTTRKDEE